MNDIKLPEEEYRRADAFYRKIKTDVGANKDFQTYAWAIDREHRATLSYFKVGNRF